MEHLKTVDDRFSPLSTVDRRRSPVRPFSRCQMKPVEMSDADLQNYVKQKIASGQFGTAEEFATEAIRVYRQIEQEYGQPLMATARPDLGEQVHTFAVDNYVVIYQPKKDGIRVLMVLHGSRDIPPILKKRKDVPPEFSYQVHREAEC